MNGENEQNPCSCNGVILISKKAINWGGCRDVDATPLMRGKEGR